jgi:hypothetical protein
MSHRRKLLAIRSGTCNSIAEVGESVVEGDPDTRPVLNKGVKRARLPGPARYGVTQDPPRGSGQGGPGVAITESVTLAGNATTTRQSGSRDHRIEEGFFQILTGV